MRSWPCYSAKSNRRAKKGRSDGCLADTQGHRGPCARPGGGHAGTTLARRDSTRLHRCNVGALLVLPVAVMLTPAVDVDVDVPITHVVVSRATAINASWHGHLLVVQLLVDRGAEVNLGAWA